MGHSLCTTLFHILIISNPSILVFPTTYHFSQLRQSHPTNSTKNCPDFYNTKRKASETLAINSFGLQRLSVLFSVNHKT